MSKKPAGPSRRSLLTGAVGLAAAVPALGSLPAQPMLPALAGMIEGVAPVWTVGTPGEDDWQILEAADGRTALAEWAKMNGIVCRGPGGETCPCMNCETLSEIRVERQPEMDGRPGHERDLIWMRQGNRPCCSLCGDGHVYLHDGEVVGEIRDTDLVCEACVERQAATASVDQQPEAPTWTLTRDERSLVLTVNGQIAGTVHRWTDRGDPDNTFMWAAYAGDGPASDGAKDRGLFEQLGQACQKLMTDAGVPIGACAPPGWLIAEHGESWPPAAATGVHARSVAVPAGHSLQGRLAAMLADLLAVKLGPVASVRDLVPDLAARAALLLEEAGHG